MSEIFTINLQFRELWFEYNVVGIISVYSAFEHLCGSLYNYRHNLNTKEYGLFFNNVELGWYNSLVELKDENNEIYIKIKNLRSWFLWNTEYYQFPSSPEEKKEIQTQLLFFSNQNEKACNPASKIALMCEMFDYLEEIGYKCLNESEELTNTLILKIEEFYEQNPGMFFSLKPQTKQFIFALSGIPL